MRDGVLFCAVDGFGGAEPGARAAQIVVRALAGATSPEAVLQGLEAAHLEIADVARQAQVTKMGAAVAIALRTGPTVELFHVGDARAYLATPSAVSQLTEDHTLASQLVRLKQLRAEDAAGHPASKTLVRYVGKEGDLKIERKTVELHAGETLVLCTRGIHRALADDAYVELARATEAQLPTCIEKLIGIATSDRSDGPPSLLAIRPSAPAPAPPSTASGGLRGLVEGLLTTPSPEADLEQLLADLLDLAVEGAPTRAGVLVASEDGRCRVLARRAGSEPDVLMTLEQAAQQAASGAPPGRPAVHTWSVRPGPGDRAVALALAAHPELEGADFGPILEVCAWVFALQAIVDLRKGTPSRPVS